LYTPVEQGADGKYYLLYPSPREGAGEFYELSYTRGDQLPHYLTTVTPGYFGGYWTLGEPYRIFADRVFQCDFSRSPLAGRENDIAMIIEDRARGLWIRPRRHGPADLVFHKRLDDFTLQVEGLPTEANRSVCLTVEPRLPGLESEELRLFWRFADSPWRGGHCGNSITIHFPSSGQYKIELMGMDPLGGASQVLTFAVDATVPLPDTKLVQEGPYKVRDVVWMAPVELIPSEPGVAVQLAYRVDEGPWEVAGEGKTIPMGGREPGNHVVEIAAQETEEYRDPTPVRLDIEYVPDFEFIVSSRLGTIIGDDPEQVQTALLEIETAGPAVLPIIKRKLAEVREAARLVGPLEKLLREIECEDTS
ncbi:MAG: hypothetical protein KAW89_09605, partial [Armatimonadetes bacterium]|nr:hypothetical protein [Armatimonadota bacterium]